MLSHSGGAEGRTSNMEIPCASAGVTTPRVRRFPEGSVTAWSPCGGSPHQSHLKVLSIPTENRLRETVQFGVEGNSAFLECQPQSPQATVKWLFQKDGRRKVVRKGLQPPSVLLLFLHSCAFCARHGSLSGLSPTVPLLSPFTLCVTLAIASCPASPFPLCYGCF